MLKITKSVFNISIIILLLILFSNCNCKSEKRDVCQLNNYEITTSNNTIKIKNIHENKLCYESKYNGTYREIIKSIHCPYLFIALMDHESVFTIKNIIINLIDNSLVAELPSLPNPSVLSLSPSNIYMLIDSGTSAGTRTINIIDLNKGNIVYNDNYATEFKAIWTNMNQLTYYTYIGPEAPGKPNLNEEKDSMKNSYVQKILWDNGKVIKTNEYIAAYEE